MNLQNTFLDGFIKAANIQALPQYYKEGITTPLPYLLFPRLYPYLGNRGSLYDLLLRRGQDQDKLKLIGNTMRTTPITQFFNSNPMTANIDSYNSLKGIGAGGWH